MSILAESVHCIAVCVDMAVSDRGDFCQVLHLVDIATVSTERLCDIIMYKRRQGPPKTFSQIVDVLVREKKEKKKKKKGWTCDRDRRWGQIHNVCTCLPASSA